MGWEWSRDAETGAKWSDGFSGGPGTDFGQTFMEHTWKNQDFLIFLLLDFAIFPRIPITNGWAPWWFSFFFPQAMLGGFSFRAGEHTTSAVRKIAGPNQNDYNFRKNRIGNVPEKPARKTCPKNVPGPTWAWAKGFPWGPGPRVPLGPGPKGSPGAWAQGFPMGPRSKGKYVLSVGKTRW